MTIPKIQLSIAPLRDRLLNHPLYQVLDGEETLRLFMEHHIYAVWDFMSLLKKLQQELCCTSLPWLAPTDGESARMINEIVLGEETDFAEDGRVVSHFELYRSSMIEFGSSTQGIDNLCRRISRGESVSDSLQDEAIPRVAAKFARNTFAEIERGNLCRVASAFTFGREGLLPAVFTCIVERLAQGAPERLRTFQYYLARHVELDGDSHGPMAERLVSRLCGQDPQKWQEAEEAAETALAARLELWDGIYSACQNLHGSCLP